MSSATSSTARPTHERAHAALAEYPFESRFLEVDGGRMHYVDEGPRDRTPLLMLHGNPTWSFFYRKLVTAFRGEHRVIVPDHIGCGFSDKPQQWRYDLAGHIANLERLVASLALERITLVLHDWGGAIGMGFASRHPETIARLVVLNTAAFTWPDVPLRIRICRTPVLGAFFVRRLNAFARLAPWMASARPGGLSPEARRGHLFPYDSYAHRVAIHQFVVDIPLSPRDRSYAELEVIGRSLARFRGLPACLVWGERDFVFTPKIRNEWQRRFPGAEVHPLERAGHYVLEDEPELVEHAVKRFLAKHPLAGESG